MADIEREVPNIAPDVWQVFVGWSRTIRSYYVVIVDLTGKDPKRRARDGVCYEAGLEGEFSTLEKFVKHTNDVIRWDRERELLEEMRDWPWQAERAWVEEQTPPVSELLVGRRSA